MSRLDEQLSDQFHQWELRGRGWRVFLEPVYPEPPFVPFPGHYQPPTPAIDDGRKPTFLSSLVQKLGNKLSPEVQPGIPEPEEEPEPIPLVRDSVVEFQASLPDKLDVARDIGGMDQITGHGLGVIEPLGIIASILFGAFAAWRDERARQISNLIELKAQYDYLWGKLLDRPELARVLQKDTDLVRQPISNEEHLFTRMLLIHFDTVRRAGKAGMFVNLKGLKDDLRDFINLPIPKEVWHRIKPYQDTQFIKLVESAL